MKYSFRIYFLYGVFMFAAFAPWPLAAQQSGDVGHTAFVKNQKRLALARSFVSKMKTGLARGNSYLDVSVATMETNILLDGETLLLQPILGNNLRIDGVIYGVVKDEKVLLSLRDISEVLQIPFVIDLEKKTVEGWYVREDKKFSLDLNAGIVRTDVGEFNLSANVFIEDGDVLVPAAELGTWMDFEFKPIVSAQDLRITSEELLPIQEKYRRRQDMHGGYKVPKPSRPRLNDGYTALNVPSVDVAIRSVYRKHGETKDASTSHSATFRSAGDFAYGTLSTQIQANDVDNIKNVRMKYKQESLDADLLGALKARRFEVGDITTTNVPLGGVSSQELGVRITNTDSLRTFSTPTTGISGTGFPGWDVELYRDSQLIGLKEIGDDGFYQFSDVDLFHSDNAFRLIFYGPQGEVREENLYIPVDRDLLSHGGGIYDVSISLDKKNTYNKFGADSSVGEDTNINVSALYEYSVVDGITLSSGLRSTVDQSAGDRDSVGNLGVSAVVKQALLNARVAVDDEGDMSAQLVARRDFGKHKVNSALRWRGKNFDVQGAGDSDIGTLRHTLNVNGPLPFALGRSPRYNFSTDYLLDTNDEYSLRSTVGINTTVKYLYLNEQLIHSTGSILQDDTLTSTTSVTGAYGRNHVRFLADYELKPDNELKSVLASYRRDFTNKVKLELKVDKRYDTSLTQYSAKLDWQAGFARISPRVTYNNKEEFFAGLDTRFSLLRDPVQGRVKLYDYNITNSGSVSAFVYLDKDGDGIFNGDDEPLEGVVVRAPQNGGRESTDVNGMALFTRMGRLRLTDVFVDPDTLQDPTWVAGMDGVSVVPREGNIVEVNFPIHISGELDGSVYTRAVSLPQGDGVGEEARISKSVALRNIRLKLYNAEGDLQESVSTDSSGFYYFSFIPPGRYLLIVDEKSAERGKFIRPAPQQIEIAYDGTVIYGNDIYVDMGEGDVPSAFVSDLDDYKARHPHIDFSKDEYDLVLNLGEYNSRLLMSVVWYKLQSRYNTMLTGGDLFVPPAQSYADVRTGKHTLRVGLQGITVKQAYNRCHALMAYGQYCKVEIYPSYIKQAQADISIVSEAK
ncbi:MAG: hypothetical protein COB36_01750 [Alphaproteobacteria bacterium]|nr:MAG: hypothetical protein COB36_01750 [Alphaproteobacteria bacterium]